MHLDPGPTIRVTTKLQPPHLMSCRRRVRTAHLCRASVPLACMETPPTRSNTQSRPGSTSMTLASPSTPSVERSYTRGGLAPNPMSGAGAIWPTKFTACAAEIDRRCRRRRPWDRRRNRRQRPGSTESARNTSTAEQYVVADRPLQEPPHAAAHRRTRLQRPSHNRDPVSEVQAPPIAGPG